MMTIGTLTATAIVVVRATDTVSFDAVESVDGVDVGVEDEADGV
jgi:hypothetical protein